MKLIGIINSYNGKYGTIVTKNNEIIDFNTNDISFNQNIKIGDMVEFRLETRFPDIKIARNITVIPNKL